MEKKPNTPENDIEKITKCKKNAKANANQYIPEGFMKKYGKGGRFKGNCLHMHMKGLTEHQIDLDMESLLNDVGESKKDKGMEEVDPQEELQEELENNEVESKASKPNTETCVIYRKNERGELVQETISDRFEECKKKFEEECEENVDEEGIPIALKDLLVPANVTRDAEHEIEFIGTNMIYEAAKINDAKDVKDFYVELRLSSKWKIMISKKNYRWRAVFVNPEDFEVPLLDNTNLDLLLPEFSWLVDLGYRETRQTAVDAPEETIDRITERRVELPDRWFIHGQNSGVTRYVKGEKVNRTIMNYARMEPDYRTNPDIRNREVSLDMDMSTMTKAKYFHLLMNVTNVYTARHVKYNQPLFYGIKLEVNIEIATQQAYITLRLMGLDDTNIIQMAKDIELEDFYIEFK